MSEVRVEKRLCDKIATFMNKPLAILCARYWYRGIVVDVGTDYATLGCVRAVEVTGPAATATPQTEDTVPSEMTISLQAVEQICQPLWVWHEMPAQPPEEIKKMAEEARKKAEEAARRRREEEEARRRQQEEARARQAAASTAEQGQSDASGQ